METFVNIRWIEYPTTRECRLCLSDSMRWSDAARRDADAKAKLMIGHLDKEECFMVVKEVGITRIYRASKMRDIAEWSEVR